MLSGGKKVEESQSLLRLTFILLMLKVNLAGSFPFTVPDADAAVTDDTVAGLELGDERIGRNKGTCPPCPPKLQRGPPSL